MRVCKSLSIVLASTILILAAIPAMADIFVQKNKDGTMVFSNCPQSTGWQLYLKEELGKEKKAGPSYEWLIHDTAIEYGLDPSLIECVIEVESGFNPRAYSRKGAIGLMQLLPDTAQEMGIDDPWDPVQNVKAGTRYLSILLKKYDGDLSMALAAYNAGPTRVDEYNGIPPFKETREYVKSVLSIMKEEATAKK